MGDLATLPTFAPSPASYTHADFNTAFANLTIANAAVTTNKIADAAVTLAKIATIAAATILGNNTGSAAAPIALTATQARSVLGLATTDSPTFAGLTATGVCTISDPSGRLFFNGANYGLVSATAGDMFVNAALGKSVYLSINSVNLLTVNSSGLNVNGNAVFSNAAVSDGNWFYWGNGNTRLNGSSAANLLDVLINANQVARYSTIGLAVTGELSATGTITGTNGNLNLKGYSAQADTGVLYWGTTNQSYIYHNGATVRTIHRVGGNDVLDISSTGLAVTGSLNVSDVAATSVLTSTTGTTRVAFNLVNTGGSYYLGVDNSTGSSFGGTAYALVRYAPSGRVIQDVINSAAITTVSATGLAVTGTISATANIKLANAFFLTGRNFANSADVSIVKVNTSDAIEFGSGGYTSVFIGPVIAPAATTSNPSLRLPHGAAPTTPTNGDLWTTTAGLYARINGATVGPFGAGGGGTVTAIGVTTANGVSGSSSGGATPNLTITLSAITPTTITMSGALSGATTISMSGALSGGTTADFSTEYRIAGTKVVGARGAAVTTFSPTGTYATDQGNIATAINALIGRLQAHGLIT
jgi:hypothetical protein